MAAQEPNMQWLERLRGRFVVFDGPDGSGKSTQFRQLLKLLESRGIAVCQVREPGGTSVGERIRDLLLDPETGDMDVRCEMLLYMASRAQLVARRIAPAVAAGQLVLADRFISSTLAYQGTAGGLDKADIVRVGEIALHDYWPDLVVIFDVDEQTAARRLSPLLDRIEQRGAAYHRRVRHGYLEQAEHDPDRHLVIDARSDEHTVFQRLLDGLEAKLRGKAG
ncbi:MAG: dTMP kinase [Phycisphaeraceae bacterium]